MEQVVLKRVRYSRHTGEKLSEEIVEVLDMTPKEYYDQWAKVIYESSSYQAFLEECKQRRLEERKRDFEERTGYKI